MNSTRLLASAALAVSVATPSCGAPPAAVAAGVIDIVDAACSLAEQQPDPAWVYYLCTVAGAPPGVAAQYTVRVPPTESAAFAAAHATRSGGGAR